jgi:hypothetical protein
LHHGLLPVFYDAASAAWKLDRDHPTVKRLADLKRKMDAALPASAQEEEELKKFVPMENMKFARSKHFLLLHDTPTTKGRKSRLTRADERLKLLELVYESFLLKFYLEGYEVPLPKERLRAVLFQEQDGYRNFTRTLKGDPSHTAGLYARQENVSVFYDQGTNDMHQVLSALDQRLQAEKDKIIKNRLPGATDFIRFANTLHLLTDVARENADIEVVSHEATHQMAANTGLQPEDAPVPLWAAEGLATYFESPKDAAWSGIGAVNKRRIYMYRALASDRKHSNIEFVVSDRIFTLAISSKGTSHAYGQAWALTHFLMDRHFDKLVKYYQLTAAKRLDKRPTPQQNIQAFKEVFGADLQSLELDWRKYMRSLKTDVERILEAG